MALERKYGTFNLGVDQVEDEEMAEPIMAVMGTVIVLQSEYDYVSRVFRYRAWSPHFEEVDEGVIPPEYEPSMDEQGNVTWEKVDG